MRPSFVFTVGQVAAICNVKPDTVKKWFDYQYLRGYVSPGSNDRRIPHDRLVAFLKRFELPTHGLEYLDEIVGPLEELCDAEREKLSPGLRRVLGIEQ